MKKLVSALLVVLLALLPALAFADSAADENSSRTYTDKATGYSINYPSDWTAISKDNIQELINSVMDGTLKIEGMDTSALQTYKDQMDQMNMVAFASSDWMFNANIVCQPLGMSLSAKDLLANMFPAMLDQYKSMFSSFEVAADPAVEEYGDTEFVTMTGKYSIGAVNMIIKQAYICANGTLYVITFTINASTGLGMEDMDKVSAAMLKSFVLPE